MPVVAALAACGGGEEPASLDSNERRLTRAESAQIVEWATAFRACGLERGLALGPLAISETRIELRLPPTVDGPDVVPRTTACAEKQGGPPAGVTLQFRPGRLLLYVPKQCLLDVLPPLEQDR